ncbi:MAG: OsmC family protein [Cytophagales bacterium]|nr:OsmC family protein [Cytophagales bacterium]
MKVTIDRLDQAFHMQANNENGNQILMDTSVQHGGSGKGFSPMQLLLAGAGGCSTIDIVSILKKQRQDLKDIKIEITGDRNPEEVPALFKKIHMHYKVYGNIAEEKVERAISLSLEKYCSVSLMLEKACEISSSFEVIPV